MSAKARANCGRSASTLGESQRAAEDYSNCEARHTNDVRIGTSQDRSGLNV
jgi:hypothetical protein